MGWIVVIGVVGAASTSLWLLWLLFVRPFAIASGALPLTAYDHVVRGWKAERRGVWDVALLEYEKAIELNPDDPDAHSRRAALLAAHPELADCAE
jgi:hypothetical protein